MKTNESKKGISLIVLIITIIVMIILAAAIILNIDDTKIINKAERAANENSLSIAKEIRVVAKAEWRANEEKLRKEGYASFASYFKDKLEAAEVGDRVKVSPTGDVVIIPEGYVASQATGENEVETGLVIYETTTAVTDANVEIAKKEYNQYVWVPVPDMSEFVRKDYKGLKVSESTSYRTWHATDPTFVEKIAKAYAEMIESVSKYGGFYIGRYEAAYEKINGESVITTRKSGYPENQGWYTISGTMDKLSNDSVVAHTIYGEEWDAALSFIANFGVRDAKYAMDSTGAGYYLDYSPTLRGSNEAYSRNNIYDMAGNVWEVTEECYRGYWRLCR